MKGSIKSDARAKRVTITLSEIDLEKMALESFYQSEKRVRQIVNNIGKELTREILQSHDIDNKTIERDGRTCYRKEASTGHYQTLYGESPSLVIFIKTAPAGRHSARWKKPAASVLAPPHRY